MVYGDVWKDVCVERISVPFGSDVSGLPASNVIRSTSTQSLSCRSFVRNEGELDLRVLLFYLL